MHENDLGDVARSIDLEGLLTSVQAATQAPSGAKGKTTWALAMAAAAAATMAEAKRMVDSWWCLGWGGEED